jgi:hypothetical protein
MGVEWVEDEGSRFWVDLPFPEAKPEFPYPDFRYWRVGTKTTD